MTSDQVKDKGFEVYTSRPRELIKTVFLMLTWVILGAHLEIVGPTLKILAEKTQVNLTDISTILICRNAGYIIANIAGALLQKVVQKYPESLLSISFLIASIAVLGTPLISSLYILSTLFFFQGISQGTTDLGGTSLMLRMWGDDVSAPLNCVHLGFGFGAVLANLLVKPFLGQRQTLEKGSDNETSFIKNEIANIQVPYSIISFLCLIIAVGHLIFSICEYRNRREPLENRPITYSSVSTTIVKEKKISEYSPRQWGKGSFSYGLVLSIIWIFYMFFLSGNDQTFGKFFFEFLKTPKFEISSEGATYGMIIYWLSYSVGRLICAVVSLFTPVHIALIGLWICGFVLAITWFIFVWIVELNSSSLFILGGFTGLIFSPTFPLSFAFINQRLNVNPFLVALLLSGAAFGGMIFQKLGGFVLDRNRKHFPTLLITCVLSSIVLFVLAMAISSIYERKSIEKKKSIPIEENQRIAKISEEEQQMETYLTNNQQDDQ